MTDEKATFWAVVWEKMVAISKWTATKLLAPGVALILVLVVILLVSMGFKDLQIGGLLAKLFGRKEPEHKAIDVANSVPSSRVDKNGSLIPEGTPDSQGQTQAVVVPIQPPGVFSNPSTVTFTPPGKTEPVEVQLPDGVKNRDVETVVIVQPNKFVVSVKDNSGVTSQKIDDLLSKYGG